MNWLKSFFTHNFTYKFGSLLVAFLFWFVLQSVEILEVNTKVKIIFHVPVSNMIKDGPVRYKDITIRGSRSVLSGMSKDPIEAHIHLSREDIGKLRFRVDKEYISDWNPKVKLTVHDPYLNVFVDNKAFKTVPIRGNIQGLPAEGYFIEKTIVEPKSVAIEGLRTKMNLIQYVLTEAIDVEGLDHSQEFQTEVIQKGVELSGSSSGQVKIFVQVGEKKVNHKIDGILIESDSTHPFSLLRPQQVSVVIQARGEVLKGIKKEDFQAFIDTKDLKEGMQERKIVVKIPADTVLIETIPETAMIIVPSKHR